MVSAGEASARRLAEESWLAEETRHRERVKALLGPHLKRRSAGEKHPVYDFLFEYYSFRPSGLAEWSPGADVELIGPAAERFLRHKGFVKTPCGVVLPASGFPKERSSGLDWIARLLEQTFKRPPVFGCHGLHEWAMVYREGEERRHQGVPLRLPQKVVDQTVETLPLACTHFDAFRFFTEAARPKNRWELSREAQPELEQPGCLHANMDLYRHAYKLSPYVPSSLLLAAFELAILAREIDMRASPYDLDSLGYPAIRIETPEGRGEYAEYQQEISRRAQPLRAELLEVVKELSAGCGSASW